jgi:hypothetical protein
MRGQDKSPIGVFKPVDEEQYAPNNPRNFQGAFGSSTFRAGVLSGEATVREVAAYLLDDKHFSDVPATSLIRVSKTVIHPVGSPDFSVKHFSSTSSTSSHWNYVSSEE